MIKKILRRGKQFGFDALEITVETSKINTFNFENGVLNTNEKKLINFITIRALLDKKIAVYQDQNFDFNIEKVFYFLKESLLNMEALEEASIIEGSEKYSSIKQKQTKTTSTKTMLEKLKNLSFNLTSAFEKIVNTTVSLEEEITSFKLFNSYGLKLKDKYKKTSLFIMAKAFDKEYVTNSVFLIKQNFSDFIFPEIVNNMTSILKAKLFARNIVTGKYTVILNQEIFGQVCLEFLDYSLNAKNIYEKISPLKQNLGEKVFDESLTIFDEPLSENEDAFLKTRFDSEGVATSNRCLVENGTVKNFLSSLKSAKLLNIKPTGNCDGIHVLVIKPGIYNRESILKAEKSCLIIDSITDGDGFFHLTGDFSLPCEGYFVENGKITYRFKNAVISGNFFELLSKNIKVLNDYKGYNGYLFCPSVLIKEVNISGE